MKNFPWFVYSAIYFISLHNVTVETKKKTRQKEIHIKPKVPQMGQEGQLTCPTFGNKGCQLICEIFCDFYGCTTNQGKCSNHTCYCFETYDIFSEKLAPQQLQYLSASILWQHKFGFSPNAMSLFYILQKSDDLWENIEPVLRNPAQTAISVKSHILSLHPDWTFIHNLKPVRQGYVDDFIRENSNKYDDEHIEHYNEQVMEYIADKYYYSLREYKNKPHLAMGKPNSHQQMKYFYKLINLCQNYWLIDYLKDFVNRKRYSDSYLASLLDPDGRKRIAKSGLLSLIIISMIDHVMTYEKKYDKNKILGSRKHTVYYILSKRQIDELNDFDFDDFEEEMLQMQQLNTRW